ncbi:hypothetical protein LAZ67_12003119, partial [Cordylochernes scorpioides]
MDKLKKACETKKRTLESVIAEADGELGKQEPSLEMLMSLRPKLLRCKDRFLIASDCLIEQLIKADREDEEIEDVDIVQANLFGRSEGVLQKMEQLLAKPTVDRESIVSGGNEGKSNLHRLPKLELPKFGGESREWLQFWSAFQSVHDDDSISACVKFQYLQNCMIKGSVSEEIVSSFPNSAANYPLAISTLKERFGREDMLVEVYVRDLIAITLENAHGRNTTPFPTVYVRLSSQLRALESLGVTTDKCAAILYPMVESALPEDLFVAWERTRHHHKPDEDGKHKSSEVLLEKLMEFLKHEVEGSERMRLARQPFSSSYPSQFNRDKPPKPKTSVATAASLVVADGKSNNAYKCVFCDEKHLSEQCCKAMSMSLEERRKIIQEKQCCYSCLKPGHFSKYCRNVVKCVICSKKHRAILCPVSKGSQNSDGIEERSKNINASVDMSNQIRCQDVLLQTIMVKINGENKSKVVRAMLDSGSQNSYVLEQTASEVGLTMLGKKEVVHLLFGGVKSRPQQHKRYRIYISDVDSKYNCNFEVQDCSTICSAMPSAQPTEWMTELRSKGIDLDVYRSNTEIELLLGADVYAKLLTGKKIELESGPVALETKLGWTVSGKVLGNVQTTKSQSSVLSCLVRDATIQDLRRLDVISIMEPMKEKSKEELSVAALEHFNQTVKQNEDGRYSVNLPWIGEHPPLPNYKLISEKKLESTTALAGIKRDMNWSVFVAGRVKKIRQNSSITDWRHVPGKENPADIPSRGASISQLITTRWWERPVRLKKEEQFWTQSAEKESIEEVNSELRKAVVTPFNRKRKKNRGRRISWPLGKWRRNTITRTTNEIKSGLSLEEVDIILIRAKFERLTILNDRLILIDDKIKEILLDDPRSTEAQINDEMELCETYSLQVGIVAQKVKEYESKLAAPCDDKMSQFSTSDVKRQIKLPKFELKKYTGELEEWLSWWSHFEKIHLDESLSDVDKFEYLIQSMVVGSKAHRLVTSFPLTQKNYNKVIGDLKDRFGDRDMLTELYVRKLLKLVIASARSEKRTLAQLYDDLVAHLHSLGSLGVDTKSGGGAFLYPLVESSLPLELIKIWQRSRTPFKERDYSEIEEGIEHSGAKDFDKLEGLIEFLKQEVKNAERISFVAEGFEPSLPLKQGKRENNPPKIHTASALFVGKTNLPCLFCDKDNHLSQNCFKAAKMLESDRLKRVQDAKVCFKCLRKNHLKKDCRSFVRCKRCQGPHFEIMCRGTSHSQENLNWRSDNRSHNSLAEQNEGISEPVTAMANQVCTNNISLMTLIVKLKGPKRSKMVRVLLDSGSQKSYIRRSLAKELDLPKVGEVKLNKFLFGGQTTGEKAHSIFYFQLDNVDEGKAFKMEALEETIICGNISPVETGPRQWELDKKGITLTKVDNNKTEIDILIGGDYYGQLLTGKIEQLAGGLTAIQTVLGWTLIGNTSSERPETSAQMVITLLTTQQRVASLWELETIGIRDPTEVISVKEKNVLMQEKFREKICRGQDGRYLVSLPWKEGIGTIPNNLEIAKRRLEAVTQKLTQKGQFVPYDEVFRSWFRENLIEEVDREDIRPTGHYLPHRPIYKVQSETTPIRPVYDASCKASKRSLSLNECLETGPNLIELLPEILIRLREKKIGVIADICKAFQTVGIDEKERFHKKYLAMLVQKGNETEGRRFLPGEVVLIGRDDQKIIFWPLGRILELYPGKDGRERVARVKTATGEFVRPLKRLFSLELGSDISRELYLIGNNTLHIPQTAPSSRIPVHRSLKYKPTKQFFLLIPSTRSTGHDNHGTSLRHPLTKSSIKPSPQSFSNAIYRIPCNDCPQSYVGETGRTIATRVLEHDRNIRSQD